VGRITIIVSLIVHVALAFLATRVQEQKRKRRATTVAVVSEKKKEAKPEDKPKPPPPPPPTPKAAARPEPKAEAAPAPVEDAPKVASSEAPPPGGFSTGLELSNSGPGIAIGPAKDPGSGRKDPGADRPKAVKPVVKTSDGGGGDKGEQACTEEPTKPEPIAKTEIEYTDQARADGVEGRLVLTLTIGASGEVTDVKVDSGVQASLDAAAVATVKTWRFKPALRCGKPIAGGTYRIARRFELGD
jgi:protein TonB